MAVPVARMRLTVEVLPLEAANAHGPYRAQAIAAFKGRKFALPVQLEDTFERVWGQIEQRYKTNYLDAQQAAAFTIKKLQDAYDCDLDLGDTVSSIFEGEPDPTMRMIKVVPSFINRDFSVPVTSNLRPGYAQKRVREINEELANKRRRVEQQQLGDIQEVDPSRDQPMPTTESERSGDDGAEQSGHRSRSRTGTSLVVVKDTHTGHAEFGPGIKEESPELGLPITQKAPSTASVETTFTKPPVPISKKSPRKRKSAKSRSRTPRVPPVMIPEEQVENGVPELDDAATQNVPVQGKVAQNTHRITASPKLGSPETALHPSPKPIPGPSQETPSSAAVKRKDVYDVPSSPEFLKNKSKPKSKQTYAKSPRAANTIQKEVNLLNSSRLLSTHAQSSSDSQRSAPDSLSKKARAFQLPEPPDEIQSTPQEEEEAAKAMPRGSRAESVQNDADLTAAFLDSTGRDLQNGVQTPERTPLAKPARPGSLKKPSRNAHLGTPQSAKRGIQFENMEESAKNARTRADSDSRNSAASPASSTNSRSKKLDPQIQARVDNLRRQMRGSSKVVAKQPSPRNSKQSDEDSRSVGESYVAHVAAKSSGDPETQVEKASAGKKASIEPKTITPDDTTRLSVQPLLSRPTPVRTPVPLPDNIRHPTPKENPVSAKSNTPDDAEVFKKPDLKLWSMKSSKRANSDSLERRGSGSSDRRSTPLRTEVLLSSTNGSGVKPAAEDPVRQPSSSSGIPLPANARRLSSNSSTEKGPQLHGDSSTVRSVSPAKPVVAAKRRGRPPKSSSIEQPNGNSSRTRIASPAPVLVPKRRGRSAKSTLNNSSQTPDATPVVEPATKQEAVQFVSQSSPTRKPDADEAIVISSREPSTSDYTDSEEEGQQDTVSHSASTKIEQPPSLRKQENGIAQLRKTDSTENDADADAAGQGAVEKDTTAEEQIVQSQLRNQVSSKEGPSKNGSAAKAGTWNANSWDFGALERSNDAPDTLAEDVQLQAHAPLPSQAITQGTLEDEARAGSTARASSKSSSTSAANSTRSSPAITRRPARFLSHSPTPEASDSGDESDGISAAASKATTPPLPEENSNEIESDSSSDSDESGAEDEDIEMPDVPAQAEPQFTAVDESAVPSSPPRLAIVPNSTPLVPETSQPTTSQLNPSTIRRTPVPLPPPSQLRSSQSVSVHAAARRPATRYAGFRTLREQLADAQKTPTATQTKAYDPRTMSLGKLAAKAKGRSKGFVGVGNNDGSSEEDSSSSSSDSD